VRLIERLFAMALRKALVTVSLHKESEKTSFQDRFQRQCNLMRTMASFRMCMPRSLMEMGTRVQDSAQVGMK
jgi:hypothetical protein